MDGLERRRSREARVAALLAAGDSISGVSTGSGQVSPRHEWHRGRVPSVVHEKERGKYGWMQTNKIYQIAFDGIAKFETSEWQNLESSNRLKTSERILRFKG